jgi:hypothetical protein
MFNLGDTVTVRDISPDTGDHKCFFSWDMAESVGHSCVITSVYEEHGETYYGLDNGRDWYKEEWLELELESVPAAMSQDLHVPGAKDDTGKPPVALVFESFPRALLEVAKVAGHGEKKYTRGGWRHVPNAQNRYADAASRHILRRYIDGELDDDSGLYHLSHAAWNLLAVLELKLLEQENA